MSPKKGSGEPSTRNTDSDVKNNAVTPCPETGYPSTVKFNGADVNGKGMFLPPEFVFFMKQLKPMYDWFDEEYSMKNPVDERPTHIKKALDDIERGIIDIVDGVSELAGYEFRRNVFWNEAKSKKNL